jgi:Zn ribbon nucleic-acid-binding protein
MRYRFTLVPACPKCNCGMWKAPLIGRFKCYQCGFKMDRREFEKIHQALVAEHEQENHK